MTKIKRFLKLSESSKAEEIEKQKELIKEYKHKKQNGSL